MAASSPIRSITGDEKLVLDFFATFSRFECGLKRAGFVREGVHGSASPDWKAFANAIDEQLTAATDAAFTSAKDFLLREPPQLQKYDPPKSVKWEGNAPRANESAAQYLLRLVRDVRNNLFHGGKYPESQGGPISGESLRNAKLLQACLTVLDTYLSFDLAVKSRFEEAQ
jgi:hypothetical protein